jgi:hypothetical protein
MVQYMQNLEDHSDTKQADQTMEPSPQIMMLSLVALNPDLPIAKAMQPQVEIQGQRFLFLVDSGSSTCFIDAERAQFLSGRQPLPHPVHVKVAGGAVLQCTEFFPTLCWTAAGATFTDQFRVLSLGSYDGIIGLDWLAKYSPMTTDWEQGWISFLQDTKTVILNGAGSQFCTHALVEVNLVQDTPTAPDLSQFPEIQALLQQFPQVFAAPSGLPPRR